MSETETAPRPLTEWAGVVAVGLVAGFLSGMFGVGGGVVIVPALMAVAHFDQRLASGTSLATIVPLASVGVVSYALHDSVAWLGALLLAVGAMAGAQLGTYLMTKVRSRPLQIIFSFVMVLAIVSLFLVVPSRDAMLEITVGSALGLVALGFGTGVLAGLLGVGGGFIVVPGLMLFFGVSDLIAKGTSLLMMIPAALSGTVANAKRGNVDIPAALAVGIPACGTTVVGSSVAASVSPTVANIAFSIFLGIIALRMFITAAFGGRRRK